MRTRAPLPLAERRRRKMARRKGKTASTPQPIVVRTAMTRYDLPKMIDAMHITTAVEIGVDHGWYSKSLLRDSQLSLLWSVDPFAGKQVPVYDDAVEVLSIFGLRSRIVRMTSIKAAEAAVDEGMSFGFVYIDANHRAHMVKQDIDTWLPLLARPGIMAGHDYVDMPSTGVIQAVNATAARLNMPIYLTREKWASWVLIFGATGD